ncbi:MAG: LytTR family DNA-binding domain-containing protein [Rhodothermales bacterium]
MLRTLIVDDEPPARKRLRTMLSSLAQEGRLEIVAEAGDGVEALEVIQNQPIDLLFLDIRMPELDGFAVLERIPKDAMPVVVFTTAYDHYALRAFEANAIDYLLKPIERGRLEESVARAERATGTHEERQENDDRLGKLLDWLETQSTRGGDAAAAPASASPFMRQISIPYRDRILVIPIERLASAEINEGITRLYILAEPTDPAKNRIRQHIVNYTLEQLEEHLDPDTFMRVHRSAIVHIDHIKEMIPWFSGRYKLILSGGHEVIASRERSKVLKDRLMVDLKK